MVVLLDIDGTLTEAGRPVPGAADALRTLRERGAPLLFVTNTSRKCRQDVADALVSAGIPAAPGEVLSAGHAAAGLLARRGAKRVQLVLTESAARDFAAFDVVAGPEGGVPDAVVVGDLGPEMTFSAMNAAFRSLHAGASLIATQKNRFWKAADGPSLDAGAWVSALEYAAGVEAEIVGKPEAAFFRSALDHLGAEAAAAWMVGDDLLNDVAAARACGLRAALVRTGKFETETLEAAAPEDRPDLVLDSVADLPAALERAASS